MEDLTNFEIKKTIILLYSQHNIPLSEELQKILSKSSRVHKKTLLKHHCEIRDYILSKIIEIRPEIIVKEKKCEDIIENSKSVSKSIET